MCTCMCKNRGGMTGSKSRKHFCRLSISIYIGFVLVSIKGVFLAVYATKGAVIKGSDRLDGVVLENLPIALSVFIIIIGCYIHNTSIGIENILYVSVRLPCQGYSPIVVVVVDIAFIGLFLQHHCITFVGDF